VNAEEAGPQSLSELDLARALGDAKPLGSTATDVLERMRREQLIRLRPSRDRSRWWTAAPAGRQSRYRDTVARDDAWTVTDTDALLDLIYAEHRPGAEAHRGGVQAIGRLDTNDLELLVAQLQARGLLDGSATDERWLELTFAGVELARTRWRDSPPQRRCRWDGPPPPPLRYRRGLPLRIEREDAAPGPLARGRRRALLRAGCVDAAIEHNEAVGELKRDGAATWHSTHCESRWLVYLQAHTGDGQARCPQGAARARRERAHRTATGPAGQSLPTACTAQTSANVAVESGTRGSPMRSRGRTRRRGSRCVGSA
jgi:hypothetical protein